MPPKNHCSLTRREKTESPKEKGRMTLVLEQGEKEGVEGGDRQATLTPECLSPASHGARGRCHPRADMRIYAPFLSGRTKQTTGTSLVRCSS